MTGDVPPERAARISCTLGLPDGSGYVRLASADPGVQPTSNYCHLQHRNDIRRVCEGVRLAAILLESNAFQEVADHRIHSADDLPANNDALISGSAKPWARHGTYQGLVDQYCKMKGIQNLSVADASVMPRIPGSGGAHATVIMIGERVVDWIAVG